MEVNEFKDLMRKLAEGKHPTVKARDVELGSDGQPGKRPWHLTLRHWIILKLAGRRVIVLNAHIVLVQKPPGFDNHNYPVVLGRGMDESMLGNGLFWTDDTYCIGIERNPDL